MLKRILVSTLTMFAAACHSVWPELGQTLPAGDLMAEYIRSKEEVRRKYDGKEVSVRGHAPLQAVMPEEDEHEGLIRLVEEKDPSAQLLCRFTRNESSKFAEVRGGQHVTVKGIFSGERGTELRFCVLVNIDP